MKRKNDLWIQLSSCCVDIHVYDALLALYGETKEKQGGDEWEGGRRSSGGERQREGHQKGGLRECSGPQSASPP